MRFYRVSGFMVNGFGEGNGVMCEDCLWRYLAGVGDSGLRGGVGVRAETGPEVVCSGCGAERIQTGNVKVFRHERKVAVTDEVLKKMRFGERMSIRRMADKLGVSVATVHGYLADAGLGGRLNVERERGQAV